MGSKQAVKEMMEDNELRATLRVVKRLLDLAHGSVDEVKEIAIRMTGREDLIDEFIDFWNLVDIRCDSIMEKIELLLKNCKGETDE